MLDTTICKQTQITYNKTRVLLQTTGGKDEMNIVFMQTSQGISIHKTQNVKTHNRTTQKTIKMGNTEPTKKTGVNSGAREE